MSNARKIIFYGVRSDVPGNCFFVIKLIISKEVRGGRFSRISVVQNYWRIGDDLKQNEDELAKFKVNTSNRPLNIPRYKQNIQDK